MGLVLRTRDSDTEIQQYAVVWPVRFRFTHRHVRYSICRVLQDRRRGRYAQACDAVVRTAGKISANIFRSGTAREIVSTSLRRQAHRVRDSLPVLAAWLFTPNYFLALIPVGLVGN